MRKQKIGQVARELGISERRIHAYERAGLIRLQREPRTGDRLFGQADVAQLRTIRTLLQDRGWTLQALQQLLAYAPCWELTACTRSDTCPVLEQPTIPCYRQRTEKLDCTFRGDCQHCPVYLAKEGTPPAVVIHDAKTAGVGLRPHPGQDQA